MQNVKQIREHRLITHCMILYEPVLNSYSPFFSVIFQDDCTNSHGQIEWFVPFCMRPVT